MLSLAAAVVLAACGGSDGPTDPGSNDGGDTGGETRSIKADPSFASDIMEVFVRRGCTSAACHGGDAAGVTLTTAAVSHAELVGVTSSRSGEILVIAGNADASYLVKKLNGSASVGAQMPLGAEPLDDIDLQNVKNWINQGAKNN